MNDSAQLPAAPRIYPAIVGVIKSIGVVAKDKVNKVQGFKYRSVDDVYSALNPALAKNGLFIVPEVLEEQREVKTNQRGTQIVSVVLTIRYTVYADDGSHISTVLKGEAMDTGDKAINKAMAIAYKYLCFQLFCIPVEEMSDPDAERPELAAPPAGSTKPERSSRRKPAPTPPEQDEETALAGSAKIGAAMAATIKSEQARTGVTDAAILKRLHSKAKKVEDMTVNEFNQAMKIFQITKDLKQEDATNE